MFWDDEDRKRDNRNRVSSDHAICPNNPVRMVGVLEPLSLRLEILTGRIPTVPDDPLAARWFKTGPNSVKPAPFPGLRFGLPPNEREDLFGIDRVESYLVLYRWPKAGETVDLTEAGQGQFSTISNSLKFELSSGATFNGNCKPKK